MPLPPPSPQRAHKRPWSSTIRDVSISVVIFAIIVRVFFQHSMHDAQQFAVKLDAEGAVNGPGKIVIVTGANSGLGFDTCVALAKYGATVVMAVRSVDKGHEARDAILAKLALQSEDDFASRLVVMHLDLASLRSVRAFALEFKSKFAHVDVLINNAGIMALPKRMETEDGLEAQMATNHIAHFLLTTLLMPLMAQHARIVIHSSEAHRMCSATFVQDDLFSFKYSAWLAYSNSKAANLMHAFELNRRLAAAGNPRNITVVAVHPGYSATNLQSGRFPLSDWANAFFAMPSDVGALSQIHAAIGSNVAASVETYIGPKWWFFGAPFVTTTADKVANAESMRLLWQKSSELTHAFSSVQSMM